MSAQRSGSGVASFDGTSITAGNTRLA